jgi:anti-anti-sigma factor
MRRRLVASDPGELRTHDHTVWCGDGARDLHNLASAVFSCAAQRNERMLFVSDEPRADWLTGLDDVAGLISRGALQLVRVEDIYQRAASPREQRTAFEAEVARALADGYSGLCVVADNSRLIGSTDEEFGSWIEWEALADELQATHPLSGLCFFDRRRVPAARLADLSALHPVRCRASEEPAFQVYCERDEETLRVTGEIDGIAADQIRRLIGTATAATGRDLDFADVEFIDHRGLLTLEEVARSGVTVRLRRASGMVHRLWQLLDVPSPALELS